MNIGLPIGALNLFRISSFGFRISVGLALLVCTPFFCHAESFETAFESANKLYGQGKFAEAASAYEQILKSGRASTAVYFNLGNAFLRPVRSAARFARIARREAWLLAIRTCSPTSSLPGTRCKDLPSPSVHGNGGSANSA